MIGDKQNSEYSSIDFTCTQHAQSGRSSPAPPPSIFATRATLTSFGTLAFLCTSRLVSNKHTHPAGAKARFFIIINIYHRAAPVAFVRRMDLGVGRSRNESSFSQEIKICRATASCSHHTSHFYTSRHRQTHSVTHSQALVAFGVMKWTTGSDVD